MGSEPIPLLSSVEAREVMLWTGKRIEEGFIKLQSKFSGLVADVDTGLHNRVTKIEARLESQVNLLRQEVEELRAEIAELKGVPRPSRWRNPDPEADEEATPGPAPVPDWREQTAAAAEKLRRELPERCTIKDMREYFDIPNARAFALVSRGFLRARKEGKTWQIDRQSLVEYVKAHGVPVRISRHYGNPPGAVGSE